MGEGAAAFKDMAAQLAAELQAQGEKGRDEWNKLHRKLAQVAAAASGDDPTSAGQALLKLAKDASSPQALMRTLEGRVSNASPDLLKDLVLLVAHELNMTPLGDSKPIQMADEEGNFYQVNVDRIINCSAELSAPNAPYAVLSIVGPPSSGKSYLLNCLFGTTFDETVFAFRWFATKGIMMSRCIGPSLLLLEFDDLGEDLGKDASLGKQGVLFALTISDILMINMPVHEIGREDGSTNALFRTISQERTKLPKGHFTKILVVLRRYDGEVPLETLGGFVLESMENIWESVNKESVKFKDYIEVNIVGLPDKDSRMFPKEVTKLRKQLSNNRSAKFPASSFSDSSRTFWDAIKRNKKPNIHQFCRDEPGQSIIPSKSSITPRPSSGHAEASGSTHSNNYSSATEPMAMTFEALNRITEGFSEMKLLGTGGYGKVYKGVLDNGEVIAVKKLNSNPELVEQSFKNELLNLTMVQHKNIIRLVGYYSETQDKVVEHEGKLVLAALQERALCLEYMEGGTLEKLLSDKSCRLDWDESYKIIKGICHGLKYLQTGFKDPIYHLDLKPANILLDEDRIPKIGDFGLSRLLNSAGTFVTQTSSGTLGYMPPEYTQGLQISSKFDVFSLGVIIIEIIAGPEGLYNYKCICTSSQEFIDHVTGNLCKRVQEKTMSAVGLLEAQICIKMALRCVEDDRAKRPTITEIVEELNMIDLQLAPFRA